MRLWVKRDNYGKWTTVGKSKKYKSEEEIKCYIKVQFVKCEEPKGDNVQIITKSELFGAYEEVKKDPYGNYVPTGRTMPTLVILDYELMAAAEPSEKKESGYQDLKWF